jgi:hypothetical protein
MKRFALQDWGFGSQAGETTAKKGGGRPPPVPPPSSTLRTLRALGGCLVLRDPPQSSLNPIVATACVMTIASEGFLWDDNPA